MNDVPEPGTLAREEVESWVARERDAAWSAKLVILRLTEAGEIAMAGQFLAEHVRHIDELYALSHELPSALDEPAFVTREPSLIGAVVQGGPVLDVLERIEKARIAAYESHLAAVPRELRQVLGQHCNDARARLHALRRRTRNATGSLAA